ncbi:MAG: carboxypeptidase regulatory-like domain-containing protein, partial [Thermoflexales bacterium]|nr:carboxypeptidase regulatory-like domain-containing protein [Thermoflexales bacterium]
MNVNKSIRVFIAVGIALLGTGAQPVAPSALAGSPGGGLVGCMTFTPPPNGPFSVGDSYSESGLTLTGSPFHLSDGSGTSLGRASKSDSSHAGGSPPEMQLNNITVETSTVSLSLNFTKIEWKYAERGGNINLSINGELANFENFADMNGALLGGVHVAVTGGNGQDNGEVTLYGEISSFGIGGQELWIDDLCFTDAVDPIGNQPINTKSDLGDAPDSANHFGSPYANTAYAFPATVLGKFPSTFDPATAPPAQGQGPKHLSTAHMWLGAAVTAENEADQPPDSDGFTNILNGGADLADMDRADDGWLNRYTAVFTDCETTELVVRVTRSSMPLPPTMGNLFLNVWFDGMGNQPLLPSDGDWQDLKDCPNGTGVPAFAREWIVRDAPIPMIPTNSAQVFTITTNLVPNNSPTLTHWLRFSLSEQQAITRTSADDADGRGPVNGFRMGETEDYLYESPPPPPPPPPAGKTDLGDAPDNTNHWGSANTAYTFPALTPGRYPTVWNSGVALDPSGPIHQNSAIEGILGMNITREDEADLGPDADVVNNIKTGGIDSANYDQADDGWLNPGAPFPNCATTTLKVRVRKGPAAVMPTMILNVFFDGNRDGDWNDIGQCPPDAAGVAQRSNEWIVQNWVVNMTGIPLGGFFDYTVPTRLILNSAPTLTHWVRFTLSDGPAVLDTALIPARADGRGPLQPGFFKNGETEDYIIEGQNPQGQPGVLTIDKSVINPFGANTAGKIITYVIELQHTGGTLAASTTLTDPLPAQVIPVGLPVVSNPIPSAGPLVASLAGNLITWNGWINPGGKIRIEQPVRVKPCFGAGPRTITNRAYALQTATAGGGVIADQVDIDEFCLNGVAWGGGITYTTQLATPYVLPGDIMIVRAIYTNTTNIPIPLRVSLNGLPPGQPRFLAPEKPDVELDRCPGPDAERVVVPPNGSAQRVYSVRVPNGRPLDIWTQPGDVDGDGTFDAALRMSFFDIFTEVNLASNPDAELSQFACRATTVSANYAQTDLGDAPDGSNHPAAGMSAYPAIPASFPTVFDPATGTPSGPRHWRPWHFHLGPRVSVERDADMFPDQDAPFTNLRPAADQKDLDNYDDGIAPGALAFQNCQISTFPVQVFIDPAARTWMISTTLQGYLNVWLDSNQDGDWDDTYDCSGTAQGAFALDHIAINRPINPASLAIGMNTIFVTTGRVRRPNTNPAWMRVTLTTVPISLPLSASLGGGIVNYSDGRGENYRLGETEDYLYRDPAAQPNGTVDVQITKHGEQVRFTGAPITPGLNSPNPSSALCCLDDDSDDDGVPDTAIIVWSMEFNNKGTDTTTKTIRIRESPTLAWSVARAVVIGPNGVPEPDGFTADRKGWDGTIKGNANYRMLLAMTRTVMAETEIVTNTVVVSATGDIDLSNNDASAVVVVPGALQTPGLTGPGDGTICTGTFTVTGWASPGALVRLFVDGAEILSATSPVSGIWALPVSGLANGMRILSATAQAGLMVLASVDMKVFVDDSLAYSPLSLRFTDPAGIWHRPVGLTGRTDDGGWALSLHPFTAYTITVRSCCQNDPNAAITVKFGPTDTVTLTDPDADGLFEGVYTTGNRTTLNMVISVTCFGIIKSSDGTVLIDPFGYVTDITTSALLSGATVTNYELQGALYNPWNAAAYGQINPQVTLADGFYSFFTPPGTYQIGVTRAGYQSHRSADIVVTNALVRYDVALTPVPAGPVTHEVMLLESGPFPQVVRVKPSSVVKFTNWTVRESPTRCCRGGKPYRPEGTTAWDSGMLAPGESFSVVFDELGVFEYDSEL